MQIHISSVVSLLLVLGFPFIMTEVVDSFSKCSNFFLNQVPPEIDSPSEDSNYVCICQKYNKKYRFATLYDKANRIPIFSAYTFTGVSKHGRSNRWMIEHQLEPTGADMTVPYVNQASYEDYCNKDNNNKFSRGHLFPNSYAGDEDTAKSTFTLTNIVPQKASFNSGSWNTMEDTVKTLMTKNCRDKTDNNKILAYVLTGSVPGNNKLNGRVTIPSSMWMAFCCYYKNKFVSAAYWAPNEDDEGKSTIKSRGQEKSKNKAKKEIPKITLVNLEKELKGTWPNIKLFDSCSEDFLAENYPTDVQTAENNQVKDLSCEETDV